MFVCNLYNKNIGSIDERKCIYSILWKRSLTSTKKLKGGLLSNPKGALVISNRKNDSLLKVYYGLFGQNDIIT